MGRRASRALLSTSYPTKFPKVWRLETREGHLAPAKCEARFLPACLQSPGVVVLPICPCPPGLPRMTWLQPRANDLRGQTDDEAARGAWVPAEAASRGLGAGKSAEPPASPRLPAPAKVELPPLRFGDSRASLSRAPRQSRGRQPRSRGSCSWHSHRLPLSP